MALTFSIQLGLNVEACRIEDRWQGAAQRWFGSSRDNTSCAGRFDFGSLDDGVQPADRISTTRQATGSEFRHLIPVTSGHRGRNQLRQRVGSLVPMGHAIDDEGAAIRVVGAQPQNGLIARRRVPGVGSLPIPEGDHDEIP